MYRNTSASGSITNGSFEAKIDFSTGYSPRNVGLGDIDGDGKPDLAVTNGSSNTVSVFRNTSVSGAITESSFAAKVDFTTGGSPYSVVIGDVDGDGKPDLVIANQDNNTVSVFRNTSASGSITVSSFASKVDFTTGWDPFGVAIGDLDGDGKTDLVVTNFMNNTVSVFRNTGTSGSITASSFASKVDFTTGSEPYSVVIGDVDGDGKPDIVVANEGDNNVSVFRNTSTSGSLTASSFASKVDFTTGVNPRSVDIGDVDGDGKTDVVVTNWGSNTVSILRNTSASGSITASSFASKVDFTTGSEPNSVAIGDLDGDGKPDLVVTNETSNTVSVLRNTIGGGNIPPAAPQKLAVTYCSNQSITIKWQKNSEADFMRYRIYRNTSPSPTTKIDSTAGGNLSDTSRTYTGLINGTRYYFRVTAVDSAELESGFSNEVSAIPLSSSQEDTCCIPDLFGTGMFINQIMADDTSGIGWQGANGAIAWQNHTRIYILKKNGYYPYNAQFLLQANRKLVIRAEDGNYPIPASGTADFRPQIYGYPTAGVPPGRFVRATGVDDIIILKNVSICGIDESQPGTIDKNPGYMIEISSTGTGSIYVDNCVLKTVSSSIINISGGATCHAHTIKLTNSLIADMGFIGNSNLAIGRGIDLRNSEIDTVIVENNTFINFQDRVIRHLISLFPIHSIKFNHNTVINGMSYNGMISLGWLDSLSDGPFEIKDNLFLDNFAMGPDTDYTRQAEFTDSPDKDPLNSLPKISWICARPNTTAHITPWIISNNYYAVSDSGNAMRNLNPSDSYLRTPYPESTEPIMTSDIKRQLAANGGDTVNAFRECSIVPVKIPMLMTKLIRWYYTPEGDGIGGNTIDNVGAGAGKKKTGASGTPAAHFIHDVTNNVWVYDYNRQTTMWYMDSVNCSYYANTIPTSTDGKTIGDPRWNFLGLIPGTNIAPASPQNLIVTDSSNQSITIKWRKNSETDFMRYRIYRGTSPSPTTKIDSTAGGNLSDTSRTYTGLINGTRYYFIVTAVDSAGLESGFSNEVSATPDVVPCLPPSPPSLQPPVPLAQR